MFRVKACECKKMPAVQNAACREVFQKNRDAALPVVRRILDAEEAAR
jgi:hypothetical protein